MPEILDPIELKIIAILQNDCRTSLQTIAKECELTSSAVISRINKLKSNGTIIGFGLHLKRGTLGYPYEATIGIKAETPKIQAVAEEVRKQPNVIVCTKSIGKFNLCCLPIAKNIEELDRTAQRIKNIPGVKGIGVNIVLQSFGRFGIEENQWETQTNESKGELDEVDRAIINEMMKDSRASFLKIGTKINLSHQTVKKRFEKLKEKGTIIRCRAVIDNSKLGYQGTVFIFISLIQGSEKTTTLNELKKIPSLNRINSVMGAYDIIIFAYFKGLRDFTKLINDIQQIPSVGEVDVCLANFTYFAFEPIPRAPIECDSVELT